MSEPTAEFAQQVGPFRKELLAHCYRMTGSLADAEDALQDSLVRAWRGLAKFEGRSSLRTWLYRVTTHACLDLIADRRGRTMPALANPPGRPDGELRIELEPVWLEPFPDAMIEDDPAARPDAVYARREATRLAFVAALQRLPARQRAVLILREVVALSAEEVAAALEITVPTANSLLQRARATLDAAPKRPAAAADSSVASELLARFVSAWERARPDELIALLARDAIASMPPATLWLVGHADITAFMLANVWPRGRFRLIACAMNDAPAFAVYLAEADGPATLMSITVLDLDGDRIAGFHSFMAGVPGFAPARFGLAASLDAA